MEWRMPARFFFNKGFPSSFRPCSFRPFQARKTWFPARKNQPIKKMVWATEYCFVGPGLIKILAIPSLSRPGKSR
jgi:hypothetical protein